MSLEEWASLDEDRQAEVVDGRLVQAEVPDWVHEEAVAWLIAVLHAWIVPRGGRVGGSGAKLAVGPGRGRMPDVSVFLPGRRPPPRRGLVREPPDIAIEVVSPGPEDIRRDRVEKVREYAAFGIGQYWLLDPEARILEVLRLDAQSLYEHVLGALAGVVNIPGCDGLSLDLDALWARLGELPVDRGD